MAVDQYWICLKRYDSAGKSSTESLCPVEMKENCSPQEMKKQLCTQLLIKEEDKLVLKLRNPQGFLIPINKNLRPCTKAKPYILETTDFYQNVSPAPKSVTLDIYYETAKRRLEKIITRIDAVEAAVNRYDSNESLKLSAKAEEELKILEQKLDFLQSRFREADGREWKGMFKRHPMW